VIVSAVDGIARAVTNVNDMHGIRSLENDQNDPQNSLELIRYLNLIAGKKIPATPESQEWISDRIAYWEVRSGMSINDVETPGFLDGLKALTKSKVHCPSSVASYSRSGSIPTRVRLSFGDIDQPTPSD
jgi:hypothetical protein